MPSAFSVRRLEKRFGEQRALAGIDLDLEAGEVLGLLGPNGAGKSTLVRSLVGRIRPDVGEIELFGRAATESGARDTLGYVPQEIALYPVLSAAENLRVFGRYLGLAGQRLAAAVDAGLAFSNLSERADEAVETFSGGMKRRLNLAVGILHEPGLVLMDEPTVGIDPQSRERIYAMLEELRRRGVAILYTTHYMEEAERLCDRIAIIDHGRLIAAGTRDELVRSTVGGERRIVLDTVGPVPQALAERYPMARVERSRLALTTAEPAIVIAELLAGCERAGVAVRDLELVTPGLESVFLHLTGRELRE